MLLAFYCRLQVWVTRSQNDISQRDEEILRNEIDPVYGWNLKPTNPT